jgi:hypothetical protein
MATAKSETLAVQVPTALRRVVEERAEREMLSVSACARRALARAVQPDGDENDHR